MAEDIVQETFLSGLNAINTYKGWASEKTWLMTILKRRIVDYYRKKNSNKYKKVIFESKLLKNKNHFWLEEYSNPTLSS